MMQGPGNGYGGISWTDVHGQGNEQKHTLERNFGGKNWFHNHGAPFGMSMRLPWFFHQPSVFRSNRKRLNAVAIMVNVFVPWLLFCVVFALMSFSWHHSAPVACYVVVVLIFFFVMVTFGLLAHMARLRRAKETEEEYEPMWYGFLFTTCVIGIAMGVLLGCHNYDLRMNKVYDYEQLATYRDIDPANFVGQQLVDAGRVQFIDKSYLDITRSMGFKSNDIYCVAPIVSNKTSDKTYYDFWAVGKNCCSGLQGDFNCKSPSGTNAAKGGLRLMNDAERPFYRLAVQQAEATYKINTHKPLFFVWGMDPVKYTEELHYNALTMYITGIMAGLCVQVFLVVSTTLVFAKIYPVR